MTAYALAPLAQADLDAIWVHVAADNLPAADGLIDVFLNKFLLLAEHPLLGERRPELAADLRSLAAGNYVVYYRPTEHGVQIVRVLHGSRDLKNIFGAKPDVR